MFQNRCYLKAAVEAHGVGVTLVTVVNGLLRWSRTMLNLRSGPLPGYTMTLFRG